MRIPKLGTLLASLALVVTTVLPTAGIAGAAAPTTSGGPTAPSLTPPKPTKHDKKTRGHKGIKGDGPVTHASGFSTLSSCSGACYFYAGARRGGDSATPVTGVASQVRVAQPAKDSVDYHSLAEISAQKTIGGQQQIIEVGWTVDPTVNGGSTTPHLFVYRWINGVGGNYNGSGWVDYASNATNAGSDVSADIGTQPWMEIQYSGGNWWIFYKNNWIGYFPESLWTNAGVTGFNNTTFQQTFGEIAAAHDPTCTDMGNGNFPSASGTYPGFGADFYSLNTNNGSGWAVTPYGSTVVSDSTKWDALLINGGNGTPTSLRYGGPGATTCP